MSQFQFSAVECGIKYADKLDFCLIYSEKPCVCSALFTTNRVFAAPVRLSKERYKNPVHAIVVNSSNANACTGLEGYEKAIAITKKVATSLGVADESVLNASTGVIGVQLPLEKMLSSVDKLVEGLDAGKTELFAKAIMTTDTVPKYKSVGFKASGKEYKIEGFAKGSGMIAPNMATLLSFLVTDAPISRKDLDECFSEAIGQTYNKITIDGDMSTNDSAYILAPESDAPLTSPEDLKNFSKALFELLETLSLMLVADGEGVTRTVKIGVLKAATKDDAFKCAKSIAESLLVKTAIFGKDPNWGRIACAAGYSGANFDQDKISILIEGIPLFFEGKTVEYNESELSQVMEKDSYSISVELNAGQESAEYLTSDLTYDYVKINAEYTT